ncbi:unnamed protein product [Arctia plantaginis]|uniref:Transposase n=1 Tax=Arctia plantaginis TaxID=874455 RepID=A0A8S1AIA8_ARCPL|nr:unnamed protein product [Arctia plantaginis]
MCKKGKRSGGVKRKIKREYKNITNYQPNENSDTESSFIENEKNVVMNRAIYSQAPLQSTSYEGSAAKTSNIDIESENLIKPWETDNDIFSCSSTSKEDEFSENLVFRRKIKEWAIERNISQKALSDFATILNCRFPGILPRDARAIIGVCNFNAKHGCLKCVTVGEYSYLSHTVTFPETICHPRTDQEFREKKYGNHHKKDSPLLKLPVDMTQNFPVADSLHLVDLGIMKRLFVVTVILENLLPNGVPEIPKQFQIFLLNANCHLKFIGQ